MIYHIVTHILEKDDGNVLCFSLKDIRNLCHICLETRAMDFICLLVKATNFAPHKEIMKCLFHICLPTEGHQTDINVATVFTRLCVWSVMRV